MVLTEQQEHKVCKGQQELMVWTELQARKDQRVLMG